MAEPSESSHQDEDSEEKNELYFRRKLIKSLTKLLEFTSSDGIESEGDTLTQSTEKTVPSSDDGNAAPLPQGGEAETSEGDPSSGHTQQPEEDREDMEFLATLLSKAVDQTAATLQRVLDSHPDLQAVEETPEGQSQTVPSQSTADQTSSRDSGSLLSRQDPSDDPQHKAGRGAQGDGHSEAVKTRPKERSGDGDQVSGNTPSFLKAAKRDSRVSRGHPARESKSWPSVPASKVKAEQDYGGDKKAPSTEEEKTMMEDEQGEEGRKKGDFREVAKQVESVLHEQLHQAGLDTQGIYRCYSVLMCNHIV